MQAGPRGTRGSSSPAPGVWTQLIWCRGERLRALYHLGEWEELGQEAAEVLGWVEERGGGQLAVFAHVELAQLLVHRGELALAAEHVDALLPWARESGDPQVLVPGLTAAALVAWRGANDRDALELVREIEEKTRKEGGWRSASLTWPARIATASGWFELLDLFLDGSEQASAWDSCARPAALAGLAEARGQLEEAGELYRRAADRWAEFGSVVEQAYALLGLGRCGNARASLQGEAIFASLGASPVVAKAA